MAHFDNISSLPMEYDLRVLIQNVDLLNHNTHTYTFTFQKPKFIITYKDRLLNQFSFHSLFKSGLKEEDFLNVIHDIHVYNFKKNSDSTSFSVFDMDNNILTNNYSPRYYLCIVNSPELSHPFTIQHKDTIENRIKYLDIVRKDIMNHANDMNLKSDKHLNPPNDDLGSYKNTPVECSITLYEYINKALYDMSFDILKKPYKDQIVKTFGAVYIPNTINNNEQKSRIFGLYIAGEIIRVIDEYKEILNQTLSQGIKMGNVNSKLFDYITNNDLFNDIQPTNSSYEYDHVIKIPWLMELNYMIYRDNYCSYPTHYKIRKTTSGIYQIHFILDKKFMEFNDNFATSVSDNIDDYLKFIKWLFIRNNILYNEDDFMITVKTDTDIIKYFKDNINSRELKVLYDIISIV
jgi:hypothetical protein